MYTVYTVSTSHYASTAFTADTACTALTACTVAYYKCLYTLLQLVFLLLQYGYIAFSAFGLQCNK